MKTTLFHWHAQYLKQIHSNNSYKLKLNFNCLNWTMVANSAILDLLKIPLFHSYTQYLNQTHSNNLHKLKLNLNRLLSHLLLTPTNINVCHVRTNGWATVVFLCCHVVLFLKFHRQTFSSSMYIIRHTAHEDYWTLSNDSNTVQILEHIFGHI